MTDNDMILEPKGKAPAVGHGKVDVKTGVARDALAVAMQVGDILLHMSPESADETARALMVSANTVRALKAQRDGQILPGA
jgi:hypothetical protein